MKLLRRGENKQETEEPESCPQMSSSKHDIPCMESATKTSQDPGSGFARSQDVGATDKLTSSGLVKKQEVLLLENSAEKISERQHQEIPSGSGAEAQNNDPGSPNIQECVSGEKERRHDGDNSAVPVTATCSGNEHETVSTYCGSLGAISDQRSCLQKEQQQLSCSAPGDRIQISRESLSICDMKDVMCTDCNGNRCSRIASKAEQMKSLSSHDHSVISTPESINCDTVSKNALCLESEERKSLCSGDDSKDVETGDQKQKLAKANTSVSGLPLEKQTGASVKMFSANYISPTDTLTNVKVKNSFVKLIQTIKSCPKNV